MFLPDDVAAISVLQKEDCCKSEGIMIVKNEQR